jgi:hypothetical protein
METNEMLFIAATAVATIASYFAGVYRKKVTDPRLTEAQLDELDTFLDQLADYSGIRDPRWQMLRDAIEAMRVLPAAPAPLTPPERARVEAQAVVEALNMLELGHWFRCNCHRYNDASAALMDDHEAACGVRTQSHAPLWIAA